MRSGIEQLVRCFMRALPFVTPILLLAGCSQSPEQKQAEDIRRGAQQQADAISNRAEAQVALLDQQAAAISNEAKQAGGYAGKRLNVRAEALNQEAKLVRQQADEQGDAAKEAADARVKALRSR
jgi:hypothetical protein